MDIVIVAFVKTEQEVAIFNSKSLLFYFHDENEK
jgi:hypothetical protein